MKKYLAGLLTATMLLSSIPTTLGEEVTNTNTVSEANVIEPVIEETESENVAETVEEIPQQMEEADAAQINEEAEAVAEEEPTTVGPAGEIASEEEAAIELCGDLENENSLTVHISAKPVASDGSATITATVGKNFEGEVSYCFYWYYKADGDEEWTEIPGEMDETLSLTGLTAELCNARTYYCVASTQDTTATSNELKLDGSNLTLPDAGSSDTKQDTQTATSEEYFTIDSDGAITGYTGTDTAVVIPSTVKGTKVTAIGKEAFEKNSTLTSVTIPDGVTEIGRYAFNKCTALANVVLPDSLKVFDDYAFRECTALTNVTIPSSVTEIEGGAFSGCTALADITIKSKTTVIRTRAIPTTATVHCYEGSEADTWAKDNSFAADHIVYLTDEKSETETQKTESPFTFTLDGDTYTVTGYTGSETEITIPTEYNGKKVTKIGNSAFKDKATLTSVTIPDGITSIGEMAFNACHGLTGVTIPASVTTIGNSAFFYCNNLASVTISSGVTTIGDYAFGGCPKLTSISIPATVTSIGAFAFSGCTTMTDATVYGWEPKIGDNAFPEAITIYCDEGSTAEMWARNNQCTPMNIEDKETEKGGESSGKEQETETETPAADFEFTYADDAQTKYAITDYKGSAAKVVIPSEYEDKPIAQIGPQAFIDNTTLTSVKIPGSVETIGRDAFNGCTALTDITIYGKTTGIGDYAIPTNATIRCYAGSAAESWAKSNNFAENQIVYLDDQKSSGTETDKTESPFTFELDGNTDTYTVKDYTGSDAEITIPAEYDGKKVTKIDAEAFKDNATLTNVTIPDGVTHIGKDAFSGCTGLTDITIPDSVTSIGGNIVPKTVTIHCNERSTAATYARVNEIKTENIGVAATGIKLNFSKLYLGKKQTVDTLKATLEPANATAQTITWTSSNPKVATVSENGEITCVASKGSTVITATAGEFKAGCTVYAKAKGAMGIKLAETANVTLNKSITLKASVSGKPTVSTVIWTSSDSEVATVSSKGVVKGLKLGTAVITATASSGYQAKCTVTVENQKVTSIKLSKTKTTLLQNNRTTLKATISPKDAFVKDVSWASSNENVATVDASGVVTAIGAGKAVITCTANDGSLKSAKCEVTVKRNPVTKVTMTYNGKAVQKLTFKVEDTRDKEYTFVGTAYPATASDTGVKYSSSNTKVVTIDENTGVFKVVGAGKATVTCASVSDKNVKASCVINVTKVAVTKIKLYYYDSLVTSAGLTFNYEKVKNQVNKGFKATVLPTNATYKDIWWKSSDKKVVTIDRETGAFTIVGTGTATIKCFSNDNGAVYGRCVITVKKTAVKSISVTHNGAAVTSKTVLKMAKGDKDEGLKVSFNPTDATNQALSWKSSDKKIVTVDGNGALTAKAKGTATITVTSKDNSKIKLSFKVKVK